MIRRIISTSYPVNKSVLLEPSGQYTMGAVGDTQILSGNADCHDDKLLAVGAVVLPGAAAGWATTEDLVRYTTTKKTKGETLAWRLLLCPRTSTTIATSRYGSMGDNGGDGSRRPSRHGVLAVVRVCSTQSTQPCSNPTVSENTVR